MRANESLRVRVLDRPVRRSVWRRKVTRLLARHLVVWTLSLGADSQQLGLSIPGHRLGCGH
jgi:hypothetical protein